MSGAREMRIGTRRTRKPSLHQAKGIRALVSGVWHKVPNRFRKRFTGPRIIV